MSTEAYDYLNPEDPRNVGPYESQQIEVYNGTGGSLAAGQLVYISGWDETTKRPKVSKADANVAAAAAKFILKTAIADATVGVVQRKLRLTALNTSGATVGDPVYLSETAGGWTLTGPTAAGSIQQIVGRVAVVSATVGVVEFDFVTNQGDVKGGTNELQDGSVTAVKLATDAVTTAKILNANVTEAKVATNSLTGTVASNVANANVIGGIPVLHRIDITAGALGDTDVTLTHKTRVVDAWLVLRGAGVATTTLQVKSTAAAITNAMAASGSDKALVRAAEIDDAAHEIAAGGILRVTSATGASQPDATVYVLGVRVA